MQNISNAYDKPDVTVQTHTAILPMAVAAQILKCNDGDKHGYTHSVVGASFTFSVLPLAERCSGRDPVLVVLTYLSTAGTASETTFDEPNRLLKDIRELEEEYQKGGDGWVESYMGTQSDPLGKFLSTLATVIKDKDLKRIAQSMIRDGIEAEPCRCGRANCPKDRLYKAWAALKGGAE